MIGSQRLQLPITGQLDLWVAVSEHVAAFKNDALYESLLSEPELRQYRALQYPEYRFDYLLGRALLRTVLGSYLGLAPSALRFERNRSGKPQLVASQNPEGLQFNLSLTDGLVACAVTAAASVGVDVEYHGHQRSMLEVADDYFSASEIADLRRLSGAEQRRGFFRYWTLKESLVKARGEGMSAPLDQFAFRIKSSRARLLSCPEGFIQPGERWDFRCFALGHDYSAAVSMTAPISQLCLRESVPLFDSVIIDNPELLFSSARQDTLASAFC